MPAHSPYSFAAALAHRITRFLVFAFLIAVAVAQPTAAAPPPALTVTFDGPNLVVVGRGFLPNTDVQLTLSGAQATVAGQDGLITLSTMTADPDGAFRMTVAWRDLGFIACVPELSPQIEARTGDTFLTLPLCDPAPLIVS